MHSISICLSLFLARSSRLDLALVTGKLQGPLEKARQKLKGEPGLKEGISIRGKIKSKWWEK
jgi:hypothetical protein